MVLYDNIKSHAETHNSILTSTPSIVSFVKFPVKQMKLFPKVFASKLKTTIATIH